MDAALVAFLKAHPEFETLHLFGYSGGGVVAALMAQDFPATERLVTVCAPLNLDGWARLHHYADLDGSVDPARERPLPAHVKQFHFAGSRDDNVPGHLVKSFADMQPSARYVEITGFNHHCCWDRIWTGSVLKDINDRQDKQDLPAEAF
jgi:pimeloyl-ACP methyl ester carboxylesterase